MFGAQVLLCEHRGEVLRRSGNLLVAMRFTRDIRSHGSLSCQRGPGRKTCEGGCWVTATNGSARVAAERRKFACRSQVRCFAFSMCRGRRQAKQDEPSVAASVSVVSTLWDDLIGADLDLSIIMNGT